MGEAVGRLTVPALRAVIVVLFAGSVFVQAVMAPLMAGNLRQLEPEHAYLGTPLLVVVVLGMVTVEVVLACVWRLGTMARAGTVFSTGALRYVHVVIGMMGTAAVLVFGLAVVLAPGDAVPPGLVMLICGASVAVFGMALIVLLLRMLLAQAVARDVEAERMGAELAAVI
jgi:Protein of unknown function (DUF2975)